jgi:hypothetical protein
MADIDPDEYLDLTALGLVADIMPLTKLNRWYVKKGLDAIKNSPQTQIELIANTWDHKYEREEAAYPSEFLRQIKYWPPVARVDNVYGDKNLVCSCPSIDEYKDTAA